MLNKSSNKEINGKLFAAVYSFLARGRLLSDHFHEHVNMYTEFRVAANVPGKYRDIQYFKFADSEFVYT